MTQTIDPTQRGQTTEADILVAFRDRLRSAIDELNELTCFISDQPIPAMIPGPSHVCVTVSVGDGTFDQSLFTGGGSATLNEQSQIVITPMIQMVIDRVPQSERVLIDASRGLLTAWKHRILSVILLADPHLGDQSKPWEPAKGTQPLCRELVRPITSSAPADVPSKAGWVGLHLSFAVSFDWNLSSSVWTS